MVFRLRSLRRRVGLAVGLLAATGLGGCASLPRPAHPTPGALGSGPISPAVWDFFATPSVSDPWSRPIASWRLRQRAALRAGRIPPFPQLPPVSAAPEARGGAPSGYALAEHYDAFLATQRRALAQDVLRWVQTLARERYVEDGPVDRWPTLSELLRSVGDDCDGLELLSYHALRQLGFPSEQIYRAILRRSETGQHHMVTLWFEDPRDPWVLDPTDTITSRLRRLSRIEGWEPLKLFSENDEFTVTRSEDETGHIGDQTGRVGGDASQERATSE